MYRVGRAAQTSQPPDEGFQAVQALGEVLVAVAIGQADIAFAAEAGAGDGGEASFFYQAQAEIPGGDAKFLNAGEDVKGTLRVGLLQAHLGQTGADEVSAAAVEGPGGGGVL